MRCPSPLGTCDWHQLESRVQEGPVAQGWQGASHIQEYPESPGQRPLHGLGPQSLWGGGCCCAVTTGRSSGRPGCCLGTPFGTGVHTACWPRPQAPLELPSEATHPRPAQGGQLRAPQGHRSRPSAHLVSCTPSRWGCEETAQETCLLTTISEGLRTPVPGVFPQSMRAPGPQHTPRGSPGDPGLSQGRAGAGA